MALAVFNHSLVRRWALALGKVHVVSETVRLARLAIDLLLLVIDGLFELNLLLDFLLLVSQDRMLALVRLE